MQNPFDIALPDPEEAAKTDVSSWRWATVIQVNPLRIMLDGDSVALDAQPSNIAGTMWEGARVYVQIIGTRPVVIGTGGGSGAVKIADEILSSSRSHTLHIPPKYQVGFSKFEFLIMASASGGSVVRPVSIFPNGYSGDYRYTVSAFEGNLANTEGSSAVGIHPRSILVGSSTGIATFTITIVSSFVFGTGHGFSQNGTGTRRAFLSGQMSDKDPSEPITHFVIATNSDAATFTSSSRVMLWGVR